MSMYGQLDHYDSDDALGAFYVNLTCRYCAHSLARSPPHSFSPNFSISHEQRTGAAVSKSTKFWRDYTVNEILCMEKIVLSDWCSAIIFIVDSWTWCGHSRFCTSKNKFHTIQCLFLFSRGQIAYITHAQIICSIILSPFKCDTPCVVLATYANHMWDQWRVRLR